MVSLPRSRLNFPVAAVILPLNVSLAETFCTVAPAALWAGATDSAATTPAANAARSARRNLERLIDSPMVPQASRDRRDTLGYAAVGVGRRTRDRPPHPHALCGGLRHVALRRGVAVGGGGDQLRAAAASAGRTRAGAEPTEADAVPDAGAVRSA